MKKGFTIVEVSLVLAIAGLIFMMVFVALPGLQTTRRDAARKEMVSSFAQQIKNYQGNNRGALPTDWEKFANNYLGDNREDPDGSSYGIFALNCSGNGNGCEGTFDGHDTGHWMIVVKGAKCDGADAVKVNNPRKAAVLYQLERGMACSNT